MKNYEFFSGDQYFSPTNNFTQLKLTPTKNFYHLVFLLYENQITEILKRLSDLLYHNLVEWSWVGKGSQKREIYDGWSVKTAANQSKLVNYTDSSIEEEEEEEEEEDIHLDVNFGESIDLVIN